MLTFPINSGTSKAWRSVVSWKITPPTSYTANWIAKSPDGITTYFNKSLGADLVLTVLPESEWQFDLYLRSANTSGLASGSILNCVLEVAVASSGDLYLLDQFSIQIN